MHIPADSSWTMRKIFGLRREGQQFIQTIVGNGEVTFLWWDNWHTLGPLFQKLGDRFAFNFGSSLNANVSPITDAGRWKWPRSRSVVIREIINGTAGNLLPAVDKVDRGVLCIDGSESHNHLSFHCPFAASVWHENGLKCGFTSSTSDLSSELVRGMSMSKYSLRSSIYKLCLAAINYIWKERNSRIFKRADVDSAMVVQLVIEAVKACALSCRNFPSSFENRNLCRDWGISLYVMKS
ncbi:hypothetical protein RHMOL_Rhmol08G0202800 [Rhododendron molle]|uniref:Uncharacterized protein n=1 Tax=Rhododendron molle TaxID=49168 RepID=A0ACC0MSG8_RHOML|nr:hypothetical protein RHMOL_Rhmol08G0202800 [Rhododendron molle]